MTQIDTIDNFVRRLANVVYEDRINTARDSWGEAFGLVNFEKAVDQIEASYADDADLQDAGGAATKALDDAMTKLEEAVSLIGDFLELAKLASAARAEAA